MRTTNLRNTPSCVISQNAIGGSQSLKGNDASLFQSYLRHYQHGGGMRFYRGSKRQYGNGLGSFLGRLASRVLPFLAPIATEAASRFLHSTSSGLKKGKSLKDAAKSALAPTLKTTINSTTRQITGKPKSNPKLTARRGKPILNRKQRGRGILHQRKVYKRPLEGKSKKNSKATSKSKRIRYLLPSNF